MGGASAMLGEARRSDTFKTAYLYEPIVVPATTAQRLTDGNPMAESARRRRAEYPSKADALRRYATVTPLRRLNAAALALYVEYGFTDTAYGTVKLKLSPAHEAAAFEASDRVTIESLRDVDRRVVVAVGTAEGETELVTWGRRTAETLPNGVLRTFGHLTHFGPLQDPVTVAADLLAFLRSS
jgi:pimeloyl-ACP methyl ester carboxylesterase